ncbi:MAG: hypothetical protein COA67_10545 [Lutibacter sp.]|nr:MAG: hypothetical protein COA67_10545 [Lutibacter sp.]
MDKLINYYMTKTSVDLTEIALERLVYMTNASNYLLIISKIENFPNVSELDLSMYIVEIAQPNYINLITLIHQKLITFKDIDAIDDLNSALQKIKQGKENV